MNTLIILGTARENRASLKPAEKAKEKFTEKGHNTTLYDVKEKTIPPLGNRTYKDDEEPVPEDIQKLRKEINKADALVYVFPEYNHSIPGILKTSIDYLYPEYDGKPFMYIPVSAGGFGGIRGLSHLHDITNAVGGFTGPNLPISNVHEEFQDGENPDLDEKFEDFVDKCESFVDKVS